MRRQSFILAALATVVWVVVGVCLWGLWVRGCRTVRSPAATRPSAARVEAFDADVMQSSRAYDAAERGKRRGKAFWNLAFLVMWRQHDGAVYTRDDILRLFGDADLTWGGPQGERFVYFFDSSGQGDEFVDVEIDSKGVVSVIGYNASSAEDFGSPWRPYAGSGSGQR
jgi:hypothetical protein